MYPRGMKGRVAAAAVVFAALVLVPSLTSPRPDPAYAAACAPTSSNAGSDVVLTFNNTTSCEWTVPAGVTSVRVLLVGGGGGGGFDIGGGGGGGGYREVSSVSTTPGESVSIVAGAGGAGDVARGTPCTGTNGSSSSAGFASGALTAIGGGGGGGQDGGGACSTDGLAGGSGGGGGVGLSWPKVGGAGTYATDGDATTFGNAGGNTPTSGSYYAGGGGGGAGAAGGNGSSNGSGSIGGAGGAGKSSNITGASVTYAGGGAGGFYQSGTRGLGGAGGGGDGGTNATGPTAGTDGLGGGGGGGGVQNCCYGQGGAGGRGVVIIRYSVADTTPPTVTLTTATLNPAQSATVQSTETGTAYIVKSTVSVSGVASITGAADSQWNSVSVTSANSNTSAPLAGLVSGTYRAYAVDAAGNLSSASANSVTLMADDPTVSITRTGSGTVGGGQDVTLTFTLSEVPTGFTVGDVTASAGTLSGFAGSGTSYTATWTPPASGSGTASVSVGANKFTDAAGNQNTASATLSIPWNADRPSVEITRAGSGTVGSGQSVSLTFTLSEVPTGFTVGDVTASAGTLSGFAGSGTSYTATWTPPASGSGTASVSVGANKFTDAAGNQNTASATLSIVYDTNPATTTTAPPALEIVVQVPTTTIAPPATLLSGATTLPVVVEPPGPPTPTTVAKRASGTSTTTIMATTTTAPASSPTTTVDVPRVPQVVAGSAAVETDGKSVKATVTRENNQIVVQAGPITARVAGVNEAGEPMSLDAEGNIRIAPGSRVRIRATGFEPGSTVDGWLFSTPVRIGSATVDEDGGLDATFVIPSATPGGAHRIAIEARTADGKPTTIAVGLRIGDFEKESNIAARLIISAIVTAALLALFLPAVSNRRRRTA